MKHNFLRRLSALALAVVMALSLSVTPAWAADSVTGIQLDNTSMTLTLSEDGSLVREKLNIVSITPAGAAITTDDIKFTSSDNNVVRVGATTGAGSAANPYRAWITARAVGTAAVTCTVTNQDGTTATQTCQVTVRPPVPTKVELGLEGPEELEDTGLTLTIGDEETLTAEVLPESATQTVTWSSTESRVATVDNNGKVRAVGAGKTTITAATTATGADGKAVTASCEVTVKAPTVPVTGVQLANSAISLRVGETSDPLKYTITPVGNPTTGIGTATDQTVRWTSDKPGIASVDKDGKVTGMSEGKAVITVTTNDGGYTSTCTVTVNAANNALELSDSNLLMEVKETRTINVDKQIPLNGVVKWTSSNPRVASVDQKGVVTAVAASNTAVTITAALYEAGGRTPVYDSNRRPITAQCVVTVYDDDSQRITGIELSESRYSLPEGYSFTLTAKLTPANARVKDVNWTSSNEDVATVENGVVTAKKAGTVTITAEPRLGTVRALCEVTVVPAADAVSSVTGNSLSTVEAGHYAYTFTSSNGTDVALTAILSPSSALDNVLWKVKDGDPAGVANVVSNSRTRATITRNSPGTTTIVAVPVDGEGKPRPNARAAEVDVTVSGVGLDHSTLTMTQNRRVTLSATAYGDANNGDPTFEWTSENPAVVTVGRSTGLLTAREPGTAVITARKGSYTAECTVTVLEDITGIITLTGSHPAGAAINMATAQGSSRNNEGTFSASGTLPSVLNAISVEKTGTGLSYVTNLAVASTEQGILHDQHHSSADTGAGVGVRDQYYVSGSSSQGRRVLSDLSFVPSTSYTGTAEISYTGMSTNNQNFTGIIRVTVNGTGDVMYSSNEGSVVNFLAEDFNLYHPNLRSVSFTPPLESRGTLYYNYSSVSQPGTKVTGSDTYNRSGTPALDKVSFVPASGYEGTVSISYKGTDTAGRSFTGRVTINVTNNRGSSGAPGDIYYSMTQDGWTTFRPADFSAASRSVLGEALSYVRFALPASSDGTLFYNYRGFGSYDGAVDSTTSYYYSGTPALSGVSFVPTTTTPSRVDIPYTGYTVRGNTFTGTIHIGERGTTQQNGLRYTVFTGRSVNFNAYDFNTACVAATGASLNYVQFSPLPAVGQGTLRYTRGNSSTVYSLSTTTRCYRASVNTWDVQLNSVSFLANNSYTGTVTIPFTGYNTNGASFNGEVVVEVTPPTSGDSVYYGTTASPIRLSSSRMQSACSGVLDGTLSYITFTSLPNSSAGRLYLGYNGFGTGSQVNTGTRYYVSGTPSIDQLSFVPRGRYSGQVTVGYTATSTNGRSVHGIITFNVANTGSSSYFSDMYNHTWAAPAVDYLYQNGVTNGVTATTFGPNQRILRCDFVLMLCRAFHFTGGSGYSFADVPADAYYANAVATAKQRGIINGDGVNFMPYSELTRQDAMVMIKNALDAAGWNVGTASTSILGRFPDGVSVAGYARDAVSTLVQMGAVNGDNGMLYPYNPITRAEAAVILHFVMTM